MFSSKQGLVIVDREDERRKEEYVFEWFESVLHSSGENIYICLHRNMILFDSIDDMGVSIVLHATEWLGQVDILDNNFSYFEDVESIVDVFFDDSILMEDVYHNNHKSIDDGLSQSELRKILINDLFVKGKQNGISNSIHTYKKRKHRLSST